MTNSSNDTNTIICKAGRGKTIHAGVALNGGRALTSCGAGSCGTGGRRASGAVVLGTDLSLVTCKRCLKTLAAKAPAKPRTFIMTEIVEV